jgi:hypothetical protein
MTSSALSAGMHLSGQESVVLKSLDPTSNRCIRIRLKERWTAKS